MHICTEHVESSQSYLSLHFRERHVRFLNSIVKLLDRAWFIDIHLTFKKTSRGISDVIKIRWSKWPGDIANVACIKSSLSMNYFDKVSLRIVVKYPAFIRFIGVYQFVCFWSSSLIIVFDRRRFVRDAWRLKMF